MQCQEFCFSLRSLLSSTQSISKWGKAFFESLLGLGVHSWPYHIRLAWLFCFFWYSKPTANCYHCIIYANLNCCKQKPKSFTREIRNFDDIDLDGLNGTLSNADWNDVFDASLFDIVVIYQRFFSILLSTVESFIPDICWLRNKPWMTGQICKAVRKRDRVVSQSDSQVKKHWSWGEFVKLVYKLSFLL